MTGRCRIRLDSSTFVLLYWVYLFYYLQDSEYRFGTAMGFIHLHVHSYYSFLDGASSIEKLLERAAALDMPALALTDHNRMTGTVKFYEKAKRMGIKPIPGAEIELENGSHLTLLCRDRQGYSNLCRLLTAAHLSGRHGRVCASSDMLDKFSAGLIALSGCRKGELSAFLAKGNTGAARDAAQFYRHIFKDGFFIELIRYPSETGPDITPALIALGREERIPVVATNNVHYVAMKDYKIKELLNAVGQNCPISKRAGYRTVEQYLKTDAEMRHLFRDCPEAVDMTEEIASLCTLDLELGVPRFPVFKVPDGETDRSYLSQLVFAGALGKYGVITPGIKDRLEYELDIICKLGFCAYFLVVWDIVRWAKEQGIWCQARGSAADSIVVYSLGISVVDPVAHALLFERFMHSQRRELPDIDLDIDRRHRDAVRDYIYRKYGDENVCCVGTINTYMARGAIRDAGKALQVPQDVIEDACSGIHYLSASRLMDKIDTLPELSTCEVYKKKEYADFFKLCVAIDRFPKHMSVHLGGLLIGNGDLSGLVPLERSSGGDVISQYDKDDIEKLGIVKMDLLALPTITVIEDTLASVKNRYGTAIDIGKIPDDDPGVFAMLRDGKAIGTFQLESPAQREMAGRLLPRCFEDIIISISLVRPGPLKSNMDKSYLLRRRGAEQVTYLHPRLKNALHETSGVILYQEQVLKVAHDLAGMSYAEADGFRRAMTHDRTRAEMEKMRDEFISCALKSGVPGPVAEEVFEQLAAFAAYGFCKAHAVTYADLAYKTLWLKYHYPAEFFAALLSNQPMGYYPVRVLLDDAKRFGVGILPVDVNRSCAQYTVENGRIRVGLLQLKGISGKTVESIISERAKHEFDSVDDFILRTRAPRNVVENLINVGAFDSIQENVLTDEALRLYGPGGRQGLLLVCDPLKRAPDRFIGRGCGKADILAQWDLLSFSMAGHPLDFYYHDGGFTRIKDIRFAATGSNITIIGSVVRYQTPPTRNGNRVVYVIMEDGTGVADITVFGDVQEKCGHVLFRTGWLMVKGKIQRRGPKAVSIIADSLSPLLIEMRTARGNAVDGGT